MIGVGAVAAVGLVPVSAAASEPAQFIRLTRDGEGGFVKTVQDASPWPDGMSVLERQGRMFAGIDRMPGEDDDGLRSRALALMLKSQARAMAVHGRHVSEGFTEWAVTQ